MLKSTDLKGVICTVVTPFNDDDTFNQELLKKDVEYILNAKVDGICACGTTGEGYTLSKEESAQVCKTVVDTVNGSLPVVGGIIQNSTSQAIEYGHALKDVGVDVLQITPPHYLFKLDSNEIIAYYEKIGTAVNMPIIIYNVVPWAMVSLEEMRRLADIPYIIGIKQSGGAISLLANLIEVLEENVSVLAALDDLHYPAIVLGADGLLAAIPTVTPFLTVELWNKTKAGNHEEARAIHEKILPVWRAVDGPNFPALLKEALRLQGRPAGKARHPVRDVTSEESNRIAKALENANLI